MRPSQAPRFHLVILGTVIAGVLLLWTTVDPITVTEYSLIFAAAALPLTYFPILVAANDPAYMGDRTNSWLGNLLATGYLVPTRLRPGGDERRDDRRAPAVRRHHPGGNAIRASPRLLGVPRG